MKRIKLFATLLLSIALFIGAANFPAIAEQVILIAVPTVSTVAVDGEVIVFDAYNIGGNNYFKLRDLAYVMSGSESQFEVGWDGKANTISLTTGKPYTIVGGEMKSKGADKKSPTPTSSKILLNGSEISFTAYNIGGNNYFKLRDLAAALDFYVDWDAAKNAVIIITGTFAPPPPASFTPIKISENFPDENDIKRMWDYAKQIYITGSIVAMRETKFDFGDLSVRGLRCFIDRLDGGGAAPEWLYLDVYDYDLFGNGGYHYFNTGEFGGLERWWDDDFGSIGSAEEARIESYIRVFKDFTYKDDRESYGLTSILYKYKDETIAKAKNIIKEIIKPNMSDREKVKAVHDYIVLNCAYGESIIDQIQGHSGTAYGPLVSNLAVCGGYTHAFNLLMDIVGIESMYVSGNVPDPVIGTASHAWNLVKLDGKWYHIDCTWDDPDVDGKMTNVIKYDYFLITDAQIKALRGLEYNTRYYNLPPESK